MDVLPLCFFVKLRYKVILIIFTNWFLQKALLIIHVTQTKLKHINCRTDIFKYSLFPYMTVEWNRLNHTLHYSKLYNTLKSSLLKIGRPMPKPTFNIHKPFILKLLTWLRLGLSHLNEHRFNHNFEDYINPLHSCSLEVEPTAHFFLHCHNFLTIRNTLLNKLNRISSDISNFSDRSLGKLILYGNLISKFQQISDINASIEYLINSKRFLCSLLW